MGWFSRKKGGERKPKTIIFAYFHGLAYALCTKADELVAFRMNAETKATPHLKGCGQFYAQTGTQGAIASGYCCSSINFYDGTQNTPDPIIRSYTGSNIAYKNTAYLSFHGFVGDNVSSVPSYSCVIKRTNLGFSDYDDIGGDVNPASAIFYILVKMTKLQQDFIDLESFKNAAYTLYREGLGVSFVMSKSQEASEWIKEILRTIDGALCINPTSGKLHLRLFRDDYSPSNLPKINEGNSNEVKFTRKAWDATYSRCTINYTDLRNFDKNSVSAVNSASRATIGYERNYEVDFMAISNPANANKVLSRLMKKMTYPFATIKFNVSSDEFKGLMVGDVLNFSNEKLGIKNMTIRIMSLGADKSGEQRLEIEAVEDIFALQGFIIDKPQENLAAPDDLSMGELEFIGAVECTAEMSDARAVIPMAVAPRGFVEMMGAQDGLSGSVVSVPSYALGVLKSDLKAGGEIDDEAYFDVEEITSLWKVSGTRAGWQRLKFTCCIDNEFINFQFRENLGGKIWRVKNLIRGLSGTKITRHYAGAKVWFAPNDANDLSPLELISPTTTIFFAAKSFAAQKTGKLEFSHSLASEKPYPPSNITARREGGKVILQWRYCEALHGANYRNADNLMAGEDENTANNDVVLEFEGKFIKTKEQSAVLEAAGEIKIYALAPNGARSDEIKVKV